MNEYLQYIVAFISTIFGGGISIFIAKYAISKALSDLNKLSEKIADITTSLAVVSVRIEKISEHESMLLKHSDQLSYLEGISGKKRKL